MSDDSNPFLTQKLERPSSNTKYCRLKVSESTFGHLWACECAWGKNQIVNKLMNNSLDFPQGDDFHTQIKMRIREELVQFKNVDNG